jgi:hypothetical protein
MAEGYLIGINGLFLDHPRTGTGVYTREVLARLVRISEPTSSQDATPSLKAGADALARPSGRVVGRTVTIDWDGYDVADPTRDVARFIVALKRLALSRLGSVRALDAVADAFAQTYAAVGRPEVAARLPCYEAAICLQIAANMARRQRPHWCMKVETMLDEGLRLLEEQE